MGTIRVERSAGLMSGSPHHPGGLPNRGAPRYGEDNAWFWGEVVGLPTAEIERLAAADII
jgi:hypothetical protein